MKNFWNCRHANFRLLLTSNFIPFLCISLLLVFQSCKKEQNTIGLELQDDLLNATFTDTTSLIAYSVLEDTLNTTGLIFNCLGYLNDDIFGTTSAGIFAQFVPEGNSLNPGDSPTIDSIVLTLRYSGTFYGDTLNPFNIKIYQLTEDILSEKTYYQNNSIAHKSNNLTYQSQFLLYPKPTSQVMVDTLKEAHIRIRLKDELGLTFLQNTDQLQTSEKFLSFFKGLYICAESYQGNGSMVSLTLTNPLSCIKIYYKNGSEKRQFSFFMSHETVRFSTYKHEYESGDANFIQQVLDKDTTKGKNLLYVQSMGGVKTKIAFPYLKALKNKNIVINKAELVITNIEENNIGFPAPYRLSIQGVSKDEKIVFIPDDALFTSESYWGGTKKDNEYKFRITRYVQNIILHDEFQPFIYLVTNRAAVDANRLIIKGTDTDARLRLDLYYTEY